MCESVVYIGFPILLFGMLFGAGLYWVVTNVVYVVRQGSREQMLIDEIMTSGTVTVNKKEPTCGDGASVCSCGCYHPTEDNLDESNPPTGESGIPDKKGCK